MRSVEALWAVVTNEVVVFEGVAPEVGAGGVHAIGALVALTSEESEGGGTVQPLAGGTNGQLGAGNASGAAIANRGRLMALKPIPLAASLVSFGSGESAAHSAVEYAMQRKVASLTGNLLSQVAIYLYKHGIYMYVLTQGGSA
jgi:hypothetical protein